MDASDEGREVAPLREVEDVRHDHEVTVLVNAYNFLQRSRDLNRLFVFETCNMGQRQIRDINPVAEDSEDIGTSVKGDLLVSAQSKVGLREDNNVFLKCNETFAAQADSAYEMNPWCWEDGGMIAGFAHCGIQNTHDPGIATWAGKHFGLKCVRPVGCHVLHCIEEDLKQCDSVWKKGFDNQHGLFDLREAERNIVPRQKCVECNDRGHSKQVGPLTSVCTSQP